MHADIYCVCVVRSTSPLPRFPSLPRVCVPSLSLTPSIHLPFSPACLPSQLLSPDPLLYFWVSLFSRLSPLTSTVLSPAPRSSTLSLVQHYVPKNFSFHIYSVLFLLLHVLSLTVLTLVILPPIHSYYTSSHISRLVSIIQSISLPRNKFSIEV